MDESPPDILSAAEQALYRVSLPGEIEKLDRERLRVCLQRTGNLIDKYRELAKRARIRQARGIDEPKGRTEDILELLCAMQARFAGRLEEV